MNAARWKQVTDLFHAALERTPGHQPAREAQRRAGGDAAAPTELSEGQRAVACVEGGQQGEGPVHDRIALGRPPTAHAAGLR